MTVKFALAYYQSEPLAPVAVSRHLEARVIRLRDHRSPLVSVEQALAALLGKPLPMSTLLGSHPDYPERDHPVHEYIRETVCRRLTVGLGNVHDSLLVDHLDTSARVIGGPVASRHAAAIFGSASEPSILRAELPVRFDLSPSRNRGGQTGRRAALIVEGRSTTTEHFLLTSLPMGQLRFLNISALTGAGGAAADLVLGDARLIADLMIATRGLQNGGWQALFQVEVIKRRPVAIDPSFRVFEVKGIDFDSPRYALNDPAFLNTYAEEPDWQSATADKAKIAKKGRYSYNHRVNDETEIKDILNSLAGYLKKNPDQIADVQKRVDTVLAAFAVASKAQATAAPGPQPFTSGASRNRPLWSDLKARRERNPAQFIRDEYSTEIEGQTLTMASVRRSDPALYQAYIGWIRPSRHPEDDLKLPRREKRTASELAALEGLSLDDVVQLHRLAAVARSRMLRQRVK